MVFCEKQATLWDKAELSLDLKKYYPEEGKGMAGAFSYRKVLSQVHTEARRLLVSGAGQIGRWGM